MVEFFELFVNEEFVELLVTLLPSVEFLEMLVGVEMFWGELETFLVLLFETIVVFVLFVLFWKLVWLGLAWLVIWLVVRWVTSELTKKISNRRANLDNILSY